VRYTLGIQVCNLQLTRCMLVRTLSTTVGSSCKLVYKAVNRMEIAIVLIVSAPFRSQTTDHILQAY
jgi:hypothetical protein